MHKLPNRIFFTGVPGSRWSGIAQILEELEGVNTSDHTPEREYDHSQYSGHRGSYFGSGFEFEAKLDADYIDSAWKEQGGCKIIKSHEWSMMLPQVRHTFPEDWILLVYRPDMVSYAWWHEAGGFNIAYPDYKDYIDSPTMFGKITTQNSRILRYAAVQNALSGNVAWEYFTPRWIEKHFGQRLDFNSDKYHDVLVTLIK